MEALLSVSSSRGKYTLKTETQCKNYTFCKFKKMYCSKCITENSKFIKLELANPSVPTHFHHVLR